MDAMPLPLGALFQYFFPLVPCFLLQRELKMLEGRLTLLFVARSRALFCFLMGSMPTFWFAGTGCLQNEQWVEELHFCISDWNHDRFCKYAGRDCCFPKCFPFICKDIQDFRAIPCKTLAVLLIGCEILESNYLNVLTT